MVMLVKLITEAMLDAYHEVKAISTHRVSIVGQHESCLVCVEEGGETKNDWSMDCPSTAFSTVMVAGMQQLTLHVRIVDKAVIFQRPTAPYAFSKLVLISTLHRTKRI